MPISLSPKFFAANLGEAGVNTRDLSRAVTETESRHAKLIASGDIPQGVALPCAGPLAETNGSGMASRVAIEAHKTGVKFTTVAFAKDAVPALGK